MTDTARHDDNLRRFELLRALNLLNADPDPAFDRLVRIAAAATDAPIALLTFIGPGRQWIPARVGWEEASTTLLEAFCVHALDRPQLLEVPDASLDERFRTNALVTGPHTIRFYAGHPVVFNGVVLGTVCVLDRAPHRLSDTDRRVLADLAATAGDLLALRHRQAQLRDSERYLRTIIETEPECVKLLAPDGTLLEMNAAGLRMIEADSLDEVRHRQVLELIAEEDRSAFADLTKRVLRGGSGRLEFRVVGLKGGRRWLESHETPLRDAAGRITGVLGVTRDITERRLAQQALQEAEARLRLALDAGRIGIWDWDMASGRIVWSARHEEMWGMAPGSFRGTYEEFDARLHPEDRAGLQRAIERAIRERQPYRHEFRVLWPDGTVRWIVGRGELLYDDADQPARVIGTVIDVTERKLAEQALRDSDLFKEQIIRSAQEGIIVLDRELRYLVWNPFMERMTGMTAAEVLGKHPLEVFPALRDTGIVAALEHALDGEVVRTPDVLLAAPRTGASHWVSSEHAPLYAATGQVIGVIVTLHDVTERHRAEQALREHQRMLATVLANLPGMVYRCRNDTHWTTEFVSEGVLALTGYPPGDFIGNAVRSYSEVIHAADRERVWREVQQALAARRSYQLTYRLRTAGGEEKWVWEQGRGVYADDGALQFLEGFVTDVTERRQTEAKVERLNRVYAVLSGINAIIVRAHDRQELFTDACRVAVEAGRFQIAWIGLVDRGENRISPVAWSGAERGLLEAIAPRLSLAPDAAGRYTPVGQAVRDKLPLTVNDVAADPRVILKDALLERDVRAFTVLPLVIAGEVVAVLALLAREAGFFDDTEIRLLLELAGDIAFALDHIDKEERINYLAYYDSLTGLANRTLFHERLARFIHEAEREREVLALGIMDLDNFKAVNDALGRQAGDAVLTEFAQRLARCVEDVTQVARLGADRFAVVLPRMRDETRVMHALEEKLPLCLAQPFTIGAEELRLSAKVGVALYPNDGADADTLFRNSEAALKKAKASGERYLFYTEHMTDRVAERLALENKLRRALERSEFVLYYQPKVDATGGRVVGLEALIRWRDPENGLVLPIDFIPLMEETGIIVDVGAWVVRQAVADYRAWLASGLAVPPIAVNVSAVQLRQRDFVERIRAALEPGPAALELEITESVLMENIEENVERLNAVHALGVNIAIDDFGTGYSSLGYLARLPAQVLKIDLSFVARMLIDADVLTLVSTMISLAHSLRLKVVAEGVETERQANVLRRLKCDELQGYLISAPVPREQVPALLAGRLSIQARRRKARRPPAGARRR